MQKLFAAALVIVLGMPAAAYAGDLVIRMSDLKGGAILEGSVNGKKFGTARVSPRGDAELVLNEINSPKPKSKFKAHVVLQTCEEVQELFIQQEGPPEPMLPPGCRREPLGRFEFTPDGVLHISGNPQTPALPTGFFAGVGTMDTTKLDYIRNLEVFTGRVGTTAIPEERNSEVPTNFDNEVEVTAAAPTIALPVWRSSSRRAGAQVILSGGAATVDLNYNNTTPGQPSTTWSGEGTTLGAGVLVYYPRAEEMFEWSAMFNDTRVGEMSRSTVLDLGGGTLLGDAAKFNARSQRYQGTVGREFGPAFLYGGGRVIHSSATLSGHVDVDFSRVIGAPSTQNVTFENGFSGTMAQAVFGALLRLPGKFFVRVEAASNGNQSSGRFGAGYGWF